MKREICTWCKRLFVSVGWLGVQTAGAFWLVRGAKLIFLVFSRSAAGIWNSFRWERNAAVWWSEAADCHCQGPSQKSEGAPVGRGHICLGYRERKGTHVNFSVLLVVLCVACYFALRWRRARALDSRQSLCSMLISFKGHKRYSEFLQVKCMG